MKQRFRDFSRNASGPFAIATVLGLLFWVGVALFMWMSYDENKRLAITMTTTVRSTGSFLRVTVEDRGNGIPEEIRAKIFDPFYSTKARTEGTGLGLAISLGIARTHNGWLTFESEPGRPTRFHLDLPIDAEAVSS